MIKKSICILLLIGAVAAVVVAAIYRDNSRSLLMQYINSRMSSEQTTTPSVERDTISTDSLVVLG